MRILGAGQPEEYDPLHDKNGYYKDPTGPEDAVCQKHDKCYYQCRHDNPCATSNRNSCFNSCDIRLILDEPDTALGNTLGYTIFSFQYRLFY